VGRLGSGVLVRGSFKIFALAAGGNVGGGEENFPGGVMSGEYV